jgi:two-component system, OmpR family, response regulator
MILVVEDEPGIVDFVERGLRSRGMEVVAETDGEAGLARALDPEVELVVLDLMLPRLSGSDVLKTLHDRRPALPVIVLTAKGEVQDRIEGLDAGAVDYIVKPFSVAELAARIRAQLRSVTRDPGTALKLDGLEINLISRDVTVDGTLSPYRRLSSSSWCTWSAIADRCCRASRSCEPYGAMTTTPARTSSTCTSATYGAS